MIVVRVLVALLGAAIVIATFASSVRTVVLPRAVPARLGRIVFRSLRWLFALRARPSHSYERRDRILAMYAPIGLLSLLATWMTLTFFGYALIYWSLGGLSFEDAMRNLGVVAADARVPRTRRGRGRRAGAQRGAGRAGAARDAHHVPAQHLRRVLAA